MSCPECAQMMLEGHDSCPRCGANLIQAKDGENKAGSSSDEKRTCPTCGVTIPEGEDTCPMGCEASEGDADQSFDFHVSDFTLKPEAPNEDSEFFNDKTVMPRKGDVRSGFWERYHVQREIGRGAFGSVSLAKDARMYDREVAIKTVLFRDLQVQQVGESTRQQVMDDFLAEPRALVQLGMHHNIVHIYDVETDERGAHIVMEYLDGGSLKDKVMREGPLAERELSSVAEQLGSALEHVHKHGMVHRDIKPGNVLLTGTGMPKLVDFGLVLSNQNGQGHRGELAGSWPYMSPEQKVDSSQVNKASDIYALGATLYFAATGRPPDPDGKTDFSLVPESIRQNIIRALHENPARRFPSAESLGKSFRTGTPEELGDSAYPCYNCRKPVSPTAIFCPACGKDLPDARRQTEIEATNVIKKVQANVKNGCFDDVLDSLTDLSKKLDHPHFKETKKKADQCLAWFKKQQQRAENEIQKADLQLQKAQKALETLDLDLAEKLSQPLARINLDFLKTQALSAAEVFQEVNGIRSRRKDLENQIAIAENHASKHEYHQAINLLGIVAGEKERAFETQRKSAEDLSARFAILRKEHEKKIKQEQLRNAYKKKIEPAQPLRNLRAIIHQICAEQDPTLVDLAERAYKNWRGKRVGGLIGWILICMLLVLVAAGALYPRVQYFGEHLRVFSKEANIRRTPDVDYDPITTLYAGDRVVARWFEYSSDGHPWFNVTVPGRNASGYISAKLLLNNRGLPVFTSAVTDKKGGYVREAPGLNQRRIGTLDDGWPVTVERCARDGKSGHVWYEISTSEASGWVTYNGIKLIPKNDYMRQIPQVQRIAFYLLLGAGTWALLILLMRIIAIRSLGRKVENLKMSAQKSQIDKG